MKICMIVVNDFLHDIRVHKEAKTLAQAGNQVIVFALRSARAPATENRAGYTIERVYLESRSWPRWLLLQILKYFEFVVRAVRLIWRQNPAVVHAHDINGLVPGWIASVLLDAKLIYDSHELWSERKSRLHDLPGGKLVTQLMEGLLIRRADAVITVSQSIVQALAQRYPTSSPVLIQNTQEFEEVKRTDVLRRQLHIPSDQRIAIYPGNISPGRGLENVVLAVPHLEDMHVVIMGSDHMNGKIQRMAVDVGVSERVHFVEPVPFDDVNQYVASADVGIMCPQNVDLSYYYAAGNKLFHFVMAGIPVVVSDHPDKRRIVERHQIGVSCDETDPRSIAQALNSLVRDTGRYEQLCANARRAARDALNWQTEAAKLLALYEALA